MAVLNNPKRERFAQELAKGERAVNAYVVAGYTRDRGHATRLAANGSIQARVSELLSKAAETTLITIERLTREYKLTLADARAAGQHGVAVRALDSIAKLHGLMAERNVSLNVYANLSDGQLEAELRRLERRAAELIGGTGGNLN